LIVLTATLTCRQKQSDDRSGAFGGQVQRFVSDEINPLLNRIACTLGIV
jgi:hypothetical protein